MKILLKLLLQRLQLVLLKFGFVNESSSQTQLLLLSRFKQMAKEKDTTVSLEDVGFNVYSHTYEDGILLYIFSLIGMASKKLVDIGAGTVRGSSVANLIVNHGFSALLIDCDENNIRLSRDYYARHPETRLFLPTLVSKSVTAENINKILEENGFVGEIDLLCVDVDGMDYWILEAVEAVKPRVMLVEYNDILGPTRTCTVPYKPDFKVKDYPVNERLNNYCGASLGAFVKLGKRKGYRLVGCNRGGWNAFFAKDGLCDEYLPEVTIESCFRHEWNQYGIERRFPMVKDMDWVEV